MTEKELVALEGIMNRLFDDKLASFNERFDRIDGRFDANDEQFNKIDGRLDANEEQLNKLDKRFDAMDERFDKMGVIIETEINRAVNIFAETVPAILQSHSDDIAKLKVTSKRHDIIINALIDSMK